MMPNKSKHPTIFAIAMVAIVAACAPPMPAEAAAKNASKATMAKPTVAAQPGVPVKSADEMRARLSQTMPDVEFDEVRDSPVPGFYEVQRGANYGYISADGTYLITGDLVNLTTGEEITERSRKSGRLASIEKLGNSFIQFDPPGGPGAHVVTVFTDVDCGYCRKLHSEIASYNALGISIRYAFFPRSGPGSPSFAEAESVWCSTDQKQALTMAKLGQHLPPAPASCKTPVQQEYDLGIALGLRGTPMMVLPDGEIVNGYVPAQGLAAKLASAGFPGGMSKSAP